MVYIKEVEYVTTLQLLSKAIYCKCEHVK